MGILVENKNIEQQYAYTLESFLCRRSIWWVSRLVNGKIQIEPPFPRMSEWRTQCQYFVATKPSNFRRLGAHIRTHGAHEWDCVLHRFIFVWYSVHYFRRGFFSSRLTFCVQIFHCSSPIAFFVPTSARSSPSSICCPHHPLLWFIIRWSNWGASSSYWTIAFIIPWKWLTRLFGCWDSSATYFGNLEEPRFGPNRPAADMEDIRKFDFWVIFEDLLENFLGILVKLVRCEKKITSINQRTTKQMRFWGHYGLQTSSEVKSKIIF